MILLRDQARVEHDNLRLTTLLRNLSFNLCYELNPLSFITRKLTFA